MQRGVREEGSLQEDAGKFECKYLSLTPPLLPSTSTLTSPTIPQAQLTATEWDLAVKRMELEEGIVHDKLLLAKHQQSVQANKHCCPDPIYCPGDKVYLNTVEFCHEYKTTTNHSAKFVPHWEGPFTILHAFPEQSLYELDVLVTSMQSTPQHHVSHLKPYKESACYHQDSAPRLLDCLVQAPPCILQILEDRILSPKGQHPKVYQVWAHFTGEGPKAQWISWDGALSYDSWKEAWEEFFGEDELQLDVLDALDITADDLQLDTLDWHHLLAFKYCSELYYPFTPHILSPFFNLTHPRLIVHGKLSLRTNWCLSIWFHADRSDWHQFDIRAIECQYDCSFQMSNWCMNGLTSTDIHIDLTKNLISVWHQTDAAFMFIHHLIVTNWFANAYQDEQMAIWCCSFKLKITLILHIHT